jgi:hypothetical protein
MTNVKTEIETAGGKRELVIRVDLTKSFGPSSSGKTTIIGSTQGNQQVEPGVYVGVNVYKK